MAPTSDTDTGLRRGFPAGRAALIVYLMAGYPDRATSLASLRAAADAGADVIELGVPYGDPLADGPVIAGAGHASRLQPGGFGLAETLSLAGEFASAPGAPPVALMTYVNPMLRMGLPAVAARAAEAGVEGFIIPDLPFDSPMTGPWLLEAERFAIDTVQLTAPTSTEDRMRAVAERSQGFIYAVSSIGITGERARMRDDLGELVERMRTYRAGNPVPDIPVAVGFGISTPERAGEVARLADGVVVGSAVVKRQGSADEVGAFVSDLAAAVRDAR